jgi:hypothetical protein
MTRHKSPRVIHGMRVMCRGRGPNDANVAKLPAQFQGMLKAAIKDHSEKTHEKPNNLVWRMDFNGVIHIYPAGIEVRS